MSQQNGHTDGRSRAVTLRVFRYSGTAGAEPRFDTYPLEVAPGTTVLAALFQVRREQDSSLAFRFSCRGAVCGACAMTINGRCALACRTQVAMLGAAEVVVEPLPNLDVIRDLVVDMGPFWEKYRRVRPWLHEAYGSHKAGETPAPPGHLQSPGDAARVDDLANCILCACCYGSCPILKRQPEYLGPAALAKLARFCEDSRDHRPARLLTELDTESDGMWGCHMLHRCSKACPKDVDPDAGVAALRRRLVRQRLRRT